MQLSDSAGHDDPAPSLYGGLRWARVKLGNGSQIRVWEDVWLGDMAFKDQYTNLYSIVTHMATFSRPSKECSVNRSKRLFHLVITSKWTLTVCSMYRAMMTNNVVP